MNCQVMTKYGEWFSFFILTYRKLTDNLHDTYTNDIRAQLNRNLVHSGGG